MASRGVRRSLRLFVGNLPWTISRRELKDYFSKFGQIRQATVVFDKETGLSRGFGFVQFVRRESHMSALQQSFHILDNSKLIFSDAHSNQYSIPEHEEES